MPGYYARHLSARRLERCYEIASPRVRRYLDAEIEHVAALLRPTDVVLELGCGYGRVAIRLAEAAALVAGIDSAEPSVRMAAERTGGRSRCAFAVMDARALGFPGRTFDATICVQNGICAFGVEPMALVAEALRVTREGGSAIFSTYSDRFWDHRLAWFEAQAAEGLLGPLDRAACVDGTIACTDGFRSGRLTPARLGALAAAIGYPHRIAEVDESSVFLEILKSPGST